MDYRTREQWGATYDVNKRPIITTPVHLLFVHHNVITPTSDPNHDMLQTENTDIARFGVPSYDWGIHPSGVVLEGTTIHLSPDTYGHNSDSLSIMFMGNFENDTPTDAAMNAGRELVPWIIGQGWVADPFTLEGHRDVYATACPGANLYPRLSELLVPLTPTPVPTPTPTEEDQDMNTVVLPDGTIVVTMIGTDSSVYSTRSPDKGLTWEPLIKVGGTVRDHI